MKRIALISILLVALLFCCAFTTSPPATPLRQPVIVQPNVGLYAVIQPTDSQDLAQRKEQYNELIAQEQKLKENFNAKTRSGTAADQELVDYKNQLRALGDQMKPLSIHPEDDFTPDEKFQKNIDGYISDRVMAIEMYHDDPANKSQYKTAIKKLKYMQQVKKDYYAGKISAEKALQSFTDVNGIT